MAGPDRGADGDASTTAAAPSSLAAALDVRHNARVGLAVGIVLAALLYLPTLVALEFTLVGPGGLYLGLALVLAATVAGVVTAGLCAKTFLDPVLDRRAWLRRGGTAAIVGGVAWAILPAMAWLVDGGVLATRHSSALTGAAALALVAGTAGIHAAVRDGVEAPSEPNAASSADRDDAPTADRDDAPAADRDAVSLPGTVGAWQRRVERGAYWVVAVGLFLAAGNATGNPAPIVETEVGTVTSPFLTSAFVAVVAAIPFAATAELAGVLPARRLRALQLGALLGVLGVAWLVVLGGWAWLEATVAAPAPAALAVVTIPSGLGWAIAGSGLRSLATRRLQPERSSQDDAGRRDN